MLAPIACSMKSSTTFIIVVIDYHIANAVYPVARLSITHRTPHLHSHFLQISPFSPL